MAGVHDAALLSLLPARAGTEGSRRGERRGEEGGGRGAGFLAGSPLQSLFSIHPFHAVVPTKKVEGKKIPGKTKCERLRLLTILLLPLYTYIEPAASSAICDSMITTTLN